MIHQLVKNTRGVALVWTTLFMVVAMGVASMAVDLSYAYVVSTELKSVADAGALTAASTYLNELRNEMTDGQIQMNGVDFEQIRTNVITNVNAIIGRSRVLDLGVRQPVSVDVQFGTYTDNGEPYDGTQFLDRTDELMMDASISNEISAFRVVASRGEGGQTLSYTFASILGVDNFAVQRDSVAILAPRNFVLTIDTSGSMDDLTYLPPEGGQGLPPWEPAESFITVPPFEDEPGTPWFSPHAPSSIESIDGFDPITPQPLQVVLDSSRSFLQRLIDQASLGDSAGINYFSETGVIKEGLTLIDAESMTNIFNPLLSNGALYGNLEVGPETDEDDEPLVPHFRMNDTITFNYGTQQYDGRAAIPYGHTNIGDAIDSAINSISNSTAGATQSISVIVLFTDGEPDCIPLGVGSGVQCLGSEITPGQRTAARNYAFERARAAISQGIVIYPISYGNLDAETVTMLDEIALLSGLPDGHFAAGNSVSLDEISGVLDEIFEEIARLIPFVLVG